LAVALTVAVAYAIVAVFLHGLSRNPAASSAQIPVGEANVAIAPAE
jgi:hypothetical protein